MTEIERDFLADMVMPFSGGQVRLRIQADPTELTDRDRKFVLDLIEAMSEFAKTVLASPELPVIDLTPQVSVQVPEVLRGVTRRD